MAEDLTKPNVGDDDLLNVVANVIIRRRKTMLQEPALCDIDELEEEDEEWVI